MCVALALADFPARHFQYAAASFCVCVRRAGKGQREALSKHWSGSCLHVRLAWHKQTKIANAHTHTRTHTRSERLCLIIVLLLLFPQPQHQHQPQPQPGRPLTCARVNFRVLPLYQLLLGAWRSRLWSSHELTLTMLLKTHSKPMYQRVCVSMYVCECVNMC